MQILTVLAENRIDLVADVCTVLGEAHVNIESASFEAVDGHVIMRIGVKDEQIARAREVLLQMGFNVTPPEGIVIELPNKPNQLASVAKLFAENGISIKSTSQLVVTPGFATVLFVVDNQEKAQELIAKHFAPGKQEKILLAHIADRVWNANYAIRDQQITLKVAELKKQGRNLIELNIGDPGAYNGLYGFQMPPHFKKELVEVINEGGAFDGYADEQGEPYLREVIAKDSKERGILDASQEKVVVGNGLSELIDYLMGVIVGPGRNVILSKPDYPLYTARVNWYGGQARYYSLDPKNNWEPVIEEIERQIDENTAAIVVISPHNPTGTCISTESLRAIIDVVEKKASKDTLIISDEIYHRLRFDGKAHTPMASLSSTVPIVTLDGISKGFYSPGWRLGHMLFSNLNDDTVLKALLKVCSFRLSANKAVQTAYSRALNDYANNTPEYAFSMKNLKERAGYTVKRLDEIPGIECIPPEAAFYAFPRLTATGRWKSDKDFILDLLETEGVRVVNGSGFGMNPQEMFFRVVTLPSIEVQEEAYTRLQRFLKPHVR